MEGTQQTENQIIKRKWFALSCYVCMDLGVNIYVCYRNHFSHSSSWFQHTPLLNIQSTNTYLPLLSHSCSTRTQKLYSVSISSEIRSKINIEYHQWLPPIIFAYKDQHLSRRIYIVHRLLFRFNYFGYILVFQMKFPVKFVSLNLKSITFSN